MSESDERERKKGKGENKIYINVLKKLKSIKISLSKIRYYK